MPTIITTLARWLALLGGATLTGIIFLICLSVIGRSLNGALHSDLIQSLAPALADWLLARGIGPINGDYEIVEAGIAFAIFAFLPICQLHGAHASVDVFASAFPRRFARVLRVLTEMVFAAVLILLAWQLMQGGLSKYRSGQTTFLLEFPVWWSYAASGAAMWVAAFVGACVAVMRLRETVTGQPSGLCEDGTSQ